MEYYEALGIDKNADQDKIKKAYRKAAMKYHPDRNPDNKTAEEKFKLVNEAYSVLSDPDKKSTYDLYGKDGLKSRGQANHGQNPHDIFNDIFGDFFGGQTRTNHHHHVRQSSNLHVEIEVSIQDLTFGSNREISIPIKETCSSCNGTGSDGPTVTCSNCRGRGQVSFMRGFMNLTSTCPNCNGSGKVIKFPCKPCRASGFSHTNKNMKIDIPCGMRPGQTLRFRHQGNKENQSRPGDLLVSLNLKNNTQLEISHDNIVRKIKVDCVDAILGCEVKVKTLDGEKKVKIPMGIQHSSKIKLPGLGFPRSVNSNARGDFLLQVEITVPKSINSIQKTALETFKKENK